MKKVFALSRRSLIGKSRLHWTGFRTLKIYANKEDAIKECNFLRQIALHNYDDTVDYCVISFNVL